MKIKLTELKVAYINMGSYPNRKKTMLKMLEHYKFKNYMRIPGVPSNGRYDTIADAHINALNTGADLILEDDCLPYEYRDEIDIPEDADVVFLGVSTGTTNTHTPKYEKVSEDYYRLYDMVSLHAVLYVTDSGRRWLRNAYRMTVDQKIGFDIATAKLMPTIKAYGLNVPIWYQRDVESQTKLTLDEALLSDEYSGGGFADYPKPIEEF